MTFGRACLLMVATLCAGSPAAAAERPVLPIENFAQLPFIEHPLLSPSGKRLAARYRRGKSNVIAILELDDGKATESTLINIDKTNVTRFAWAGEDRLLLSMFAMAPVGGLWVSLPTTGLVGYDIPTKALTPLSRELRGLDNDNVIWTDPAGAFVLVSGQKSIFGQPAVFRIDTATGKAVQVQPAAHGVDQWFADGNGVVRAGFAYDARRWKLFYRDTPEAKLRQIDSRQMRDDDSVIENVRFMGEATRGAVLTNSKTGRFAAYRYDFTTDTLGEPVFEHATADASELIMSDDGARVEGVVYEDDRPRVEWLDPVKKELQRKLDAALPGKLNRVINASRDGRVVLFWSGAAHDPGGYFLFDTAARRIRNLAAPYDKIRPEHLSEVKPIVFKARDGLSIAGYLTLPHGRAAKNLPLVMLPHGGPFARDSWSYDPWVQMLADRGYAVLQANFRGSTGYGRAHVEKGYGQWGLAMQDDLDDGMDWLVGQGIADPKRTCIMGASYGGYAALWGAIRNPERYRCAISLNGVTDLRMMLKYDKRHFAAQRYARKWEARVAGEEKRDLDAVSPLRHAARLSVPLLLVHGEQDTNVPFEQATKLRDAIGQAGKAVEFVSYPKAGHNFTRNEDSIDFMRKVEAFLLKYNPA